MGTQPIWIISMRNNGDFLKRNREAVGCPVCSYPGFAAFDETGLSTYDICLCCGSQSGYIYGEDADEGNFK